jgi:hypothetical protein
MSGKNMPTKYTLEIYEPNDDSCVAAVYSSDTPFMSVAKGEYINTSLFNMSAPQGILEVVSVEHIFWVIEGSHQAQKTCIRTKPAGNPF